MNEFNNLLITLNVKDSRQISHLRNAFNRIQKFYQNYLRDLELYIKQMKWYLTNLMAVLVTVVTIVLHFALFIELPFFMVGWMTTILIGHIVGIISLIYSSVRISTFNYRFSRWYASIIYHCSSYSIKMLSKKQYLKVINH